MATTAEDKEESNIKDETLKSSETGVADAGDTAIAVETEEPQPTPSSGISFPSFSQIIASMSPKNNNSSSTKKGDPSWLDEKNDVHHTAAVLGSADDAGETTPLIDKETSTKAAAASAASSADTVVTETTPTQPETMEPIRPWFLRFIHLLQGVTSIVTAVLICLEGLAFFYLPMTLLENFLCAYLIMFGILIIITETNVWGLGDRFNKLLNFWFIRGLFYVFIGIQGLNQLANAVMRIDGGIELSRMFYRNMITIVSWMMIGVGILYFAMGVLCLHHLYDKQNEEYKSSMKVLKDWKSYNKKHPKSSATTGDNIV